MARSVIRFSISFVAVPAFMRVDPASTSGPTRAATWMSASPRVADREQVTSTVDAPRPLA
jgi:hypothetical protein